eukprot:CAMPEP_0119295262 /NCGR_PEP_ID=MMETSP1329-20130426/49461_1 /TAXON_ID=114041 /ORGANISM="Genus nov. species nov., Strain RCC1024" /LENGTH=747 /DNA_ID=CAMNT_0007296173 /DNA_START=161 /DNA_END=2401 /DNA_ORIENTATION=-
MSDSSDDDDVPLSELSAKPAAATRAAIPKKRRASAPKKSYAMSSSDGEEDSSDGEISEASEAPKPKKRKAPAKKPAAPRKKAEPRKRASGGERKPAAKKPKVPKALSRLQRFEQGIGAFEWWNAPEPPRGKAWTTLEHAGMTFEPQYVPHGVPLLYNGSPAPLTARQEELATFYASMPEDGPQLSKTGGQRDIFQKNFWGDFSAALGKGHVIQDFAGCDFSRIAAHLDAAKKVRRAASDAEKSAAKEAKEAQMLRSGFALLDGHVEKVGNFRAEPPSLFRGRGKHPKTGLVKHRMEPDRISINVGKNRPPPICLEPGRSWGDVQHDDSVTWLSQWHENVMSQNKYVMLAANSSLKGKSDYNKFRKAMQLKGCIDKVRRDYRAKLSSSDIEDRQKATTMWLIDVLALRVGGEKSEEEADTVGCCSLRVEHFTFHAGGNDVDLEFLGKDSIRFKQSLDFSPGSQLGDEHGIKAFENIKRFVKGKQPAEQVFDSIEPTMLNKHLQTIMPGLTAKVFRTYNASETLQNQLPSPEEVEKLPNVAEKVVAYNEANRKVAILCNHQRTVSASAATNLGNQADLLEQLKDQRRELQKLLAAVKAGKTKGPDVILHSGEDPSKAAAEAVEAAKKMKNEAKSDADKVAATEAYEAAMVQKREATKAKQAEAHRFARVPDEAAVQKRVDSWTEKIKKKEVDLRNKEENKEVSLGTSKANYMDPRITVAWCKRCDVPLEKMFSKTLQAKFKWALAVDGD